jgi:hypothetical protein
MYPDLETVASTFVVLVRIDEVVVWIAVIAAAAACGKAHNKGQQQHAPNYGAKDHP